MPETVQPAPETDEKKSRGLGSYVLWAFVAVMVYVLSSGPALNLADQNKRADRFADIYSPLFWLYEQTPLKRPLGIYWHPWRPDLFDKAGYPHA
jgi:hypothetical protein